MKTTIDIPDALFDDVKTLANRQGTTFKALVESSLRHLVTTEQKSRAAFRLKDASFKGQGLQPGVEEGGWPLVRGLIYAEHGG